MFEIRLGPLRCKILLRDSTGSKPDHVVAKAKLGEEDRLSYFGSYISLDDRILD